MKNKQQNKWCWVACARMASFKYMLSDISQASAAVKIKLNIETSNPTIEQISLANEPHDVQGAEDAVEYILDYEHSYSVWGKIYSENTLQSLLDMGTPIIILRGWYDMSGIRTGGHFVVIKGYHWDNIKNQYVYEILDPLPVNIGSTYNRTYGAICNGQNAILYNEKDKGIWEGIVVFEDGDYLNTINWPGVQ